LAGLKRGGYFRKTLIHDRHGNLLRRGLNNFTAMKSKSLSVPQRLLPAVALVFCLLCHRALAQSPAATLKTLYSFFNGADGAYPEAGLTLGSDGNLYGTTSGGDLPSSYGTMFKVTTGGGLSTLMTFNLTNGWYPAAALTLASDGNFYGTTEKGGTNSNNAVGTVFKVTTNGSLSLLASFNGTNGSLPLFSRLIQGSNGTFFGTTSGGGTNGTNGTVFKVTTNGVITSLVSFNGTNGSVPWAGLMPGNDGNFYGTTQFGGTNGNFGTVFKVTTNGALTSLVSFNGTNGKDPVGGLTLGSDGAFYGTTQYGGTNGSLGTVFKVTTNGVLTSLVSFNGANGEYPEADMGLTLCSDGNFYGTTSGGGTNGGQGTVFRVTTNGVLTCLVSFNAANGSGPGAGLTLGKDGNLYGSTFGGGTNGGFGTIFVLQFRPNIYSTVRTAGGIILSVASTAHSTNYVSATTNLSIPPAMWPIISTNVANASGLFQFTDTNILGQPAKFYSVSTE
jgi:uncharacterized repeat protein (TIGR03803 family)